MDGVSIIALACLCAAFIFWPHVKNPPLKDEFVAKYDDL